MPKKKILIVAATHGDEGIGVTAAKRLQRTTLKGKFDFMIGNPEAYRIKKRFIDADLNRAYPGKTKTPAYEEKVAIKNLRIARRYLIVVDIHEASRSRDSFVIITRRSIKNENIVKAVELDKVVLWPSSPSETGPLTKYVDNGFEIEIGTKGIARNQVVTNTTSIIASFIRNLESKDVNNRKKQSIFCVYGKLTTQQLAKKTPSRLVDFELTRLGQEEFYPLLTRQYLADNIVCYKMIKV